MTRNIGTRLMVLLTGLLCALVVIAPVAHAADEIGLSKDGASWSPSLSTSLFDPDFRWVPGDDETASFFVRNQGPTSALLRIEVRSADTDELLANDDIAMRVRAAGGPWVPLENGRPSSSLADGSLRKGGVVRVDVNARFDPASTNQSQTKQLALKFVVTLADALEDKPSAGESDDDGPGGGFLPATGSPFSLWQLLLASVMMAIGLAMVRRRREDKTDEAADHG